MKTVSITGLERAELSDIEEPRARGRFAKVKIDVAPMCTEYKAYRDGATTNSLGHEAAGTVVEIGREGPVRVGDRVVVMPLYPCGNCRFCLSGDYIYCRNAAAPQDDTGRPVGAATYAQYMLKNERLLLPIPDGMSFLHASMACCGLGPTFGAMQYLQVDAFDTVLILGAGPVGLGGVINGVHRGARVIVVEGHPYRARLARRLGAEEVLNPAMPGVLDALLELTRGVGVDKTIDCTGVPEARRLGIDATRTLGRMCFVGEGGELTIKVSEQMIRKGLTLRGSWHWNRADASIMFALIERVGHLLDVSITHTFPLEKVEDAWRLQISGECGKVVLMPWE